MEAQHPTDGDAATKAGRLVQFDVVLADGFVLTELAAIVDALRIANRVSATPAFSWTYRSAKGREVEGLSGARITTEPFVDRPNANYLFVVGNSDQDCSALSLGPVIDRYTNRGALVFLLAEAASRYIRERGGGARGLSTHWENSAIFRERMEMFDADNAFASQDGRVVTCAGMGTTLDVVLSVMRRHIPSAELMTVANIFLHDKIRDFGTRQPFGGLGGSVTGDAELNLAIEIMQANIEDPIPISELVELVGVSSRSLERKFRAYLETTPNTYYRQLRLAQANNLLLNTALNVREVGLACGFSEGFSVLYKKFFGITPLEMRNRRKVPNRQSE